MEKEFIPYEQALALKELGFDEPYIAFYRKSTGNLFIIEGRSFNTLEAIHFVKAPLYQQAFRWFREKYNLYITLPRSINSNSFAYLIATENDGWFRQKDRYKAYEEAELECLKKLIEIVKDVENN